MSKLDYDKLLIKYLPSHDKYIEDCYIIVSEAMPNHQLGDSIPTEKDATMIVKWFNSVVLQANEDKITKNDTGPDEQC